MTRAGLAWQACLKESKAKLDLLTDIDMLLMVEKGIRGRICHATHRYAKASYKYMKNYDKNIESSFLEFLDCKQFVWGAVSQKLQVNGFK